MANETLSNALLDNHDTKMLNVYNYQEVLVSSDRLKALQKAEVCNCFSHSLSTLTLLFLRSNLCWFLSVKEIIPEACVGCSTIIPNDHPELKELLKVSMEKYNSENSDDFYYKAGEIEAATVQVGM